MVGLLDCIKPMILHAGFLGRLRHRQYASLLQREQLKVLLQWSTSWSPPMLSGA